MLDFTEKDIVKYFKIIKRLAHKSFKKNEFEKCLKHIETAAHLAYSFNWIYKDAELEKMLGAISIKLLPSDTKYSSIKGRFAFLDYFAYDNRGLTQQYIRALISWDVEFLFLIEHDDLTRSTQIIQEIKKYKKAEIYTLPSVDNRVEKIKKAYNKIANYRPEKLFMHLHPSDVVAVTTLAAFPKITKYQINLTDHAFWLGVSVTDYSLEFRNYGFTVSLEERGIHANKLLVQPYYPISNCVSFKGLPPEVTPDKTIILSGGNFYKIYGENFAFFKILKRLLDENQSIVVIYAGSGNAKPFRKFIKENNFEKRLFLIGDRKDINHVFSVCDIYLCTFPLSGGLMTQLAAINGKPILAYTTSNLSGNFIENLLSYGVNGNNKIVYTNVDEMLNYASRLIDDKEFRQQEGYNNKSRVINPQSFSKNLFELIMTNKNIINTPKIAIDYNKFSSFYFELENRHQNSLPMYLAVRFRLLSIFLFPKAVIKFVLKVILNKREFYNLIKKITINIKRLLG